MDPEQSTDDITSAVDLVQANLARLREALARAGFSEDELAARIGGLFRSAQESRALAFDSREPSDADAVTALLERIQTRFADVVRERSAVDELIAERRMAFWREELEAS